MAGASIAESIRALPKAELHLHLEGAIAPSTARELAARCGVALTEKEVLDRYRYADFSGFLNAFKWVTSFLRSPEDYVLIARRLAEDLARQNVVYAEVTLSVGVMLLRKQDVAANFEPMRMALEGMDCPQIQWVFDATRQFGPEAAREVARWASRYRSAGVVAFAMGGDELSIPASAFRAVYDYAAESGLHRLAHAGEIGGPNEVRDALDLLGAERIGHGIAVMRDPQLIEELIERDIPLEICPTSNLRTGALARQLGKPQVQGADHPLCRLFRRGVPLVLSSDDPAMFQTDLNREYALAGSLGLSASDLCQLAKRSLHASFLDPARKQQLLDDFRRRKTLLGLV